MAVQSINNNEHRGRRLLSVGIAGAGIGAAVGCVARPSVNSIVEAAKDAYVSTADADIKFLAGILNSAKKDGAKALTPEVKKTLKDKGYSPTLKAIRQGIINLTEERNIIDGGVVYKKALKRLAKNTTAKKELVDLAKETLEFRLANSKNYLDSFKDSIINSMKSTAPAELKETMRKLTCQAVKNNAIKGAFIGAEIALLVALATLIRPKPKKEYLIVREQ